MVPTVIRQEDVLPFAEALFDREEQARKAAPILTGILDAGSPRLSDISPTMPGSPDAGYTAIQRFLAEVDPRDVLLRLVDEEAPFFLADPTEIARKQARKTDYVGRLSDGKPLPACCRQGLLSADGGSTLQRESDPLRLHHLF